MDRTEGALLVAELALKETRELAEKVGEMNKALARAFSFVLDDHGDLNMVASDGSVKSLGRIRGKDGKDADITEIERIIAAKVAEIPPAKDGTDGMGFDDLTEELEDDGRFVNKSYFRAGQVVMQARHQTKMAIFRGVHDHARTYLPGDMVTRGGSVWHCDVECKGPFNGDNWTLSAKKGRDGKPD